MSRVKLVQEVVKVVVKKGAEIIRDGMIYDAAKEAGKAVKDKVWEGHDPNKRPEPRPGPSRPPSPASKHEEPPTPGPRPKPR
jgi:hypothetical protein